MGVEELLRWISKEGRVILDAPFLFFLAVLAVLGVSAKFFLWLHKRERDNQNATIKNLEANIKLLERRLEELRTEADSYKGQLQKLMSGVPPNEVAVKYGPPAIRQALQEVTSVPLIAIYGTVAQMSADDIAKLARYVRLQELGYAQIDRPNEMTTNVASTTVGTSMATLAYPIANGTGKSS